MTISNYAFKPVGTFLQDDTYYIPEYQREYSWEGSQIEDFWTDLKNLRESDDEDHFFGQIVVQNDKSDHRMEKKYIIDGQQRTITSVIFLSAISTVCNKLMNEQSCLEAMEVSEDIRIKYIGRWSTTNDRLQLKISSGDSDFFKDFIQLRNIIVTEKKPATKAQKRIKSAYDYLLEKITNEIESLPKENQFTVIDEFYKLFINGFKIMYVETTSLEEAFIIFESLNARGKGLETSDLLKNHIFKVSKGQFEAVKRKWENMLNNLDDGDVTKFIRYYWNSKDEFVRTQSLYKKMKSGINTEGQCLQVTSQLESLSLVYTAISQKDGSTIFSDRKLNETINNLKSFGASSFYPVVLAMSNKNWEENDMLKVMKEIEKLIFRNIIIAKNAANKYEVFFAQCAVSITNTSENANEVVDKIQKMKISNDEFKGHFERLVISNKPIIRYIFKEINSLNTSGETTISNSNDVHIEHIMPVALGEWQIDEGQHLENLWRLGNLTLLGEEYNKKILNKVFEVKKEMYQKSEIHITKHLSGYDDWNIEKIKIRQDELATQALRIW